MPDPPDRSAARPPRPSAIASWIDHTIEVGATSTRRSTSTCLRPSTKSRLLPPARPARARMVPHARPRRPPPKPRRPRRQPTLRPLACLQPPPRRPRSLPARWGPVPPIGPVPSASWDSPNPDRWDSPSSGRSATVSAVPPASAVREPALAGAEASRAVADLNPRAAGGAAGAGSGTAGERVRPGRPARLASAARGRPLPPPRSTP